MSIEAAILPQSTRTALQLPAPLPPVQIDLDQISAEPLSAVQATLDLPARCGLDEVQERIRQDDRGKWDHATPRDRLALAGGQIILPEDCLDEYPERLTLSPWATTQACQRLGIPPDYFRRCSAPLQEAKFNHWVWRQYAEPD